MKKRILFCCYGGGHVRALLPVIRRAQDTGAFEVSVLGLTTAGPVLEQAGIHHFGFRDFVDPELDRQALDLGRKLYGDPNGSGPVRLDESIAYLGLSYADLAHRVGEQEAARRYSESGRGAFLPLGILERVFDRLRPDLLITTNSPRAEEAAVLVARQQGIPSMVIVDLFGLGTDLPRLKDPSYGNALCVLNEGVRNDLIAKGRPADHIHPTGNPAFDSLLHPDLPEQGGRHRQHLGWEGKTVILYASGPDTREPELPRQIESELRKVVENKEGWHLVLRPHPSERLDYSDLPANVSLSPREEDLHVLLHAVDVVVVAISTVGLEAAMAGTPLVSCDFSSWSYGVPYSRMGLSEGAPRLEDLDLAIQRALNSGARKARMPRCTAAPRILALAGRILGIPDLGIGLDDAEGGNS